MTAGGTLRRTTVYRTTLPTFAGSVNPDLDDRAPEQLAPPERGQEIDDALLVGLELASDVRATLGLALGAFRLRPRAADLDRRPDAERRSPATRPRLAKVVLYAQRFLIDDADANDRVDLVAVLVDLVARDVDRARRMFLFASLQSAGGRTPSPSASATGAGSTVTVIDPSGEALPARSVALSRSVYVPTAGNV